MWVPGTSTIGLTHTVSSSPVNVLTQDPHVLFNSDIPITES